MAPASIPNDIYQYSLLSAYEAGLKDGGPPVAFLTNHGTHGIGVFEADTDEDDDDSSSNNNNNRTASEAGNDMIQIDGVAYSIDSEGDVSPAEKDASMPFVMVTVFKAVQRAKVPTSTGSASVRDVLSRDKNTPLPFRITGRFKYINTAQQTYWDVQGTIFGFAVPEWQKAVSGAGLRSCFLSQDRLNGGKVVDFETGDGAVLEWAKCGRFHLGFPQDEEFEELRL